MKKKGVKILIIVIAVIIAIKMVAVIFDACGFGGNENEINFLVEQGETFKSIENKLELAGVISDKLAFKIYYKLCGSPIYKMGNHTFNTSMSYGEVIESLKNEGNATTITIPEGYDIVQIAETLEKEGLVDKNKFMQEIQNGSFDYDFIPKDSGRRNRLEGYLFPDTYSFSNNNGEHIIIDAMLKNFKEKVVTLYNEANSDKSLDEIITLASIIEKESLNDSERAKVASVFVNRLNIGMQLQSDVTVQYALNDKKVDLSIADTKVDSPYNTYMVKGLPIGPIASPGLESIKAALYPESTNYLYFISSNDGKDMYFFETFEQHLAKQRELQNK